MTKKYWYTLWLWLSFPALVWAQSSLLIQQLDRTDGLSQNSVIAIAQDEEGYMWFGTRDGLNKYDGYRFITFRRDQNQSSSSLPSNDIRKLYYDTLTHQLWIGTPNGVSSYNIYTHQFTNYLSNPENNDTYFVKDIFRDQAKNLWLATPKGLLLLDEQSGVAKQIPLSTTTKNVRTIYQDEEAVLWIGTTEGLFLLQQRAEHFIKKDLEQYAPGLSIFKDLCIKTI
ncbi:MAG: two-component regulator propeller domain-containing protein [Bacteroidota bacterium]